MRGEHLGDSPCSWPSLDPVVPPQFGPDAVHELTRMGTPRSLVSDLLSKTHSFA